ncbi:xylulokinase [Dethiosulfatarculus sandiegensis]|uniref:Carbohydrate kinase n=1 Tax=Dethiosulfatarculus sandiegensis TaxID=1429043 RepID=A0A0D2GCR3_9BACT|nr:FGGY family carbohydrate kinase [Dethiosulfatarculus sandiegensis]KIX12742.1 carbohydrate kinase [Dethiosulfatarculus sandiegensis]
MNPVLAFDLGGTSFKAGLLKETGEFLAQESLKSEIRVDDNGFSEIDPEIWWRGLISLTGRIMKNPKAQGVKPVAIVITGLTRTQVFLDKDGRSIRPAITWADGRALKQARPLSEAVDSLSSTEKPYGPVNAYHNLARLLWLKENDPHTLESARHILEPKDFLNFRLTGVYASDFISSSRLLAGPELRPTHRLFELLGLEKDLCPTCRWPWEEVGKVQKGLPGVFSDLVGTPVFSCSMDAWCGALGMGAVKPHAAYNVSGTSEVFGICGFVNAVQKGLVTMPWGKGLYQIGGPSQVGADSLSWFGEAFLYQNQTPDPQEVLNLLKTHKRHSSPLLFLPYLRGERTPLWDPEAKGVFLGVLRDHKAVDFAWAVLEGVAFANRQVFELATGGQTEPFAEVRISGGAANSDEWCQVKADILAKPVIRTAHKQTGLLGGLICALTGLGRYSTLEAAQDRLVLADRTFHPQENKTRAYDQLYGNWLDLQKKTLPISHALSHMTGWQ